MGSRFLNKRLTIQDGFSQGQGDTSPAAFFEGGALIVTRAGLIEGSLSVRGNIAGTAAVVNTVTAGSGAITNFRVGSSAGNNLITAIWRSVYTWNVPAIAPAGSLTSMATQDVAVSGAAVGDVVHAVPIGSQYLNLNWNAVCYTVGVVQLRAHHNWSGDVTPGNTPFKITVIKI